MKGRTGVGGFVLVGLAVALVLAVVVGPEASSAPDGLERVAIDEGFADRAADHALAGGPAADYSVDVVDDERLSAGLAGALGVVVTFVLAGGLLLVVRRRAAAPAGA